MPTTARLTFHLLVVFALMGSGFCVGTETPDGRILGGVEAAVGEYPFMVQVLSGSTYLCVGTLIHPKWVLTFAYRVYNVQNITLRVSSLTTYPYEPYRVEYYITQANVRIHPGFQYDAFDSVALLRMPYPVALSLPSATPKRVSTVIIPRTAENRQTYVGVVGKTCGWGMPNTLTLRSPTLRCKDTSPVITTQACNETRKADYLYDGMICTAPPNVGCHGDGGAPFLVRQGTGYKTIGMLSWIQADCGNGPQGYNKIAFYYSWIRSVAAPDV